MARTITRQEIRDNARMLADQVNSQFVSDDQANFWINEAVAELWDMVLNADPDRYFVETTIATNTGTKRYNLPADFYKLRYVDLVSGDERITIEPFQLAEKNRYKWAQIWGVPDDVPYVRYRIMGGQLDGSTARIFFEPNPGANSYAVGYAQAPQLLNTDTDILDGVAGWESWVIHDVAIKMMIKEETDPSALIAERARLEARIQTMAQDRDKGRAPRIQDTRARSSLWRSLY